MNCVEIGWCSYELTGTAWYIDGPALHVGMSPTDCLPSVGTNVLIRTTLGYQELKLSAIVRRLVQINGTIALLECSLSPAPIAPSHQRRANRRFCTGRLCPAFCFANSPIDGKVMAFVITDVSSGGLGLRTSASPWLLPGFKLQCRIDVGPAGTFETELVVVQIDKAGSTDYRISTEFGFLNRQARDALARCLASANTGNSLGELKREKLLPRSWETCLQQNSRNVSKDNSVYEIQIAGKLADTIVCSCVAIVRADRSFSTTRFFFSPLFDEYRLREWLEQRAIEHRNLVVRPSLGRLLKATPLSSASKIVRELTARQRHQDSLVHWDEYAEAYDTMCSVNPAYQENLTIFRKWLGELKLPENPRICDVGAGTGNFAIEAATTFPSGHVFHLDSDPVMNWTARRKYKASGIKNVSFVPSSVLNAELGESTFDLIICVNALYALQNIRSVLARCLHWLKPDGHMFLIDLGRPMNVRDWSQYMIRSNMKDRGLKATVAAFVKGRKAISQNRIIRKQQDRGFYWLHTPDEFVKALALAGLSVVHFEKCYRGVCDLAICSKS
jgi:ubiquinone/menaquinone biosynthesis C-methylase UbiE